MEYKNGVSGMIPEEACAIGEAAWDPRMPGLEMWTVFRCLGAMQVLVQCYIFEKPLLG